MRQHQQQVIDPEPQPALSPSAEIALHCRDLRKILRQKPPRTSDLQQIEQPIDDAPKISRARSTETARRRQRIDQPLLAICYIACTAQPARRCSARVVSAHIAWSLLVFANRQNHSRLKSPNSFRSRHLQAGRSGAHGTHGIGQMIQFLRLNPLTHPARHQGKR